MREWIFEGMIWDDDIVHQSILSNYGHCAFNLVWKQHSYGCKRKTFIPIARCTGWSWSQLMSWWYWWDIWDGLAWALAMYNDLKFQKWVILLIFECSRNKVSHGPFMSRWLRNKNHRQPQLTPQPSSIIKLLPRNLAPNTSHPTPNAKRQKRLL